MRSDYKRSLNNLTLIYFSGHLRDIECSECRTRMSTFYKLKTHFNTQHSGSWTHESNEVVSRKPKTFLTGMM